MTTISYAQNFEDVMLWRALRDVSQGFYVDVGANDPVIDSVTRWFYLQGWHGINVEPVPYWHGRLQEDRPRDINLQMAVSSVVGRLTLYDVPETGLATLSPLVAESHQLGGATVSEITVPAAPLDSLLAQYAGDRDIHFLKVDVEGAEREVLQSTALDRFRPWIVLVEATEPRRPVQNHHLWEELLTRRGYQFAYFDGLNRFYVADEHVGLVNALKIPPNTFDGFIRHGEWEARTSNLELIQGNVELTQQSRQLQEQLEQQLRAHGKLHHEHLQLQDHFNQLLQAQKHLQAVVDQTQEALNARIQQLRDIENSTSWRVTAPLRQMRRILGGAPDRGVGFSLPLTTELPVFRPLAVPDSTIGPASATGASDTSGPSGAPSSDLLLHQISLQWRLVDQMDGHADAQGVIHCELCGYAAAQACFKVLGSHCRFGGGTLRRYQCPHCDVIFGPLKMLRLSPEELGQEYDWHYRIFSEGDSTEQEIRAFYSLSPQKGGSYLNYGAGAWSSSVQQLRSQGWNIVAYEPTASAHTQPGLVTQREALADMRFDGIFSNNVLEHLRHPVQDLRFLAGLLRRGGRMSHATPCFEYLYEYTRFHLFFYLGRSRQLLADLAGLRICHFEQDGLYMNTVYEPAEQFAP